MDTASKGKVNNSKVIRNSNNAVTTLRTPTKKAGARNVGTLEKQDAISIRAINSWNAVNTNVASNNNEVSNNKGDSNSRKVIFL
jgi:hypothetical protein